MPNGYTRQSAASIVNGNVINASDSNNEFNALLNAFDATLGHIHDGTTVGGGAPIQSLNGVAFPASPATNTVPVVTGTNTITYEKVPNAALVNNTVTIGATSIALGASASTFAGLTLSSPSISGAALSGTTVFSGPITLTGQTLTGGTFSSPTINGATIGTSSSISSSSITTSTWTGGTIATPSISSPTVTGGTYTGGSFSTGTFTNATLTLPTINSGSLDTNTVGVTQTTADSSTKVATTAFVHNVVNGTSLVSSFNARTGAVTLSGSDVSTAQGFTSVQQGTGVGQTTDAIKIGWNAANSFPKLTVNTFDQGYIFTGATAPAASGAANGYQKLPSGIILQWGNATTASNGLAAVAFPIAFPTACLTVTCTANSLGATYVSPVTCTTNNITASAFDAQIFLGNSASSQVFYWFAVGV